MQHELRLAKEKASQGNKVATFIFAGHCMLHCYTALLGFIWLQGLCNIQFHSFVFCTVWAMASALLLCSVKNLKSLFCSDTAGRISHCKKSSRELLAFFLILFSPNKIRMGSFSSRSDLAFPFSLFYLCQNKCEQKTFLLMFFRNSSKGYKKVVTWAMLIHK